MAMLVSVREFSANHPVFSEAALRWQIFNAQHNGLAASGAVVRVGRRVLLDPEKYRAWLDDCAKNPQIAGIGLGSRPRRETVA